MTDIKSKYRVLVNLVAVSVVNLIVLGAGLFLLYTTSSQWQDVGVALTASGIVGLISIYAIKVQRSMDERYAHILNWGLEEIFDNRSDKAIYDKYLRKCSQTLDILGETLTRFYTDFGEELKVLNERNVKMRLLILDPNSSVCKMRESEESPIERGSLPGRIKEQTQKYMSLNLRNLELHWYKCTPSINYFRVDNHVFFGSYFVGIVSRNSLTYLAKYGDMVTKPYTSHFEEVWNDPNLSRTPDL